jgi:UDP-3-O-[3-hydroxymyristoyl] glucosamine N-acyltransferase
MQVSFCDTRRYRDQLRATRAGAVIVPPPLAEDAPPGAIRLLAARADLAFQQVALLFHPPPTPRAGTHPSAVVAAGATVGEGTEIGPCAIIGEGARIGPRCLIGPHAVIGPGVEIGAECRLHAHSSVSHAILGRNVTLHPGARVGQEGFGFVPMADGTFRTMPQLGRVILEDGVEIGANACVDRGALEDTVIGPGTRLDNLVQIGHNVRVGRGCILVAQSGISGSTELGDHVAVAAQAGLTGHLRIGTRARIGAQAGVIEDVPGGTDVIGSPAWPAREFWRAIARLRKLGAARLQVSGGTPATMTGQRAGDGKSGSG